MRRWSRSARRRPHLGLGTRAETMRMLAALLRFVREATPWRSLSATPEQASGATLRRTLARWARTGLLVREHATLAALLRSDPTLVVDSCSVRAKRGGELVDPNPTDRAKMGTKYHVAVSGRGTPLACVATGANVADTLLSRRLFPDAFAATVRIRTVYADRGYDAEASPVLCRRFGIEPSIAKRRQLHGSGLGTKCWPDERTFAWLLENKRLALRTGRLGVIVQSVLQAACLFLVAGKLTQEL